MPPRLTLTTAAAVTLLVLGCSPASAPLASPYRTWTLSGTDAGIASAHLTQGVQDLVGSVPLVQGRPALLRVFLGSRIAGLPAPAVRARLVSTLTGAELGLHRPTSPLAVIPTGTFASLRDATWNAVIPADQIQAGVHLVVEIDPVPGVAAGRLMSSLRIPAIGSLDVRVVPPLAVTIVPVIQSGLIPDVDRLRTAASWVSLAAAVYPFPRVDVEVAPAYTTTWMLDGSSESFSDLLEELDALRTAQGSTRHWIGAVRTTDAGTAGQAIIGGSTLLASDHPGQYQRIVAHELGHNLGLHHAPCGAESGIDPDWPWPGDDAYAGAHTGVAGWDARSDVVLDPRTTYDLMSYCGGIADTWISDFTYLKALDLLEPTPVTTAGALAMGGRAPSPGATARAAAHADPPLPVATP